MKLPIKCIIEPTHYHRHTVRVLKCGVQYCGSPAVCDMAIRGDWFPICAAHAEGRDWPRRPLVGRKPKAGEEGA